MLVSELITELKKLQEKHGDLPVEYAGNMPATSQFHNTTIVDVSAYDAQGYDPEDKNRPPAFIMLI